MEIFIIIYKSGNIKLSKLPLFPCRKARSYTELFNKVHQHSKEYLNSIILRPLKGSDELTKNYTLEMAKKDFISFYTPDAYQLVIKEFNIF